MYFCRHFHFGVIVSWFDSCQCIPKLWAITWFWLPFDTLADLQELREAFPQWKESAYASWIETYSSEDFEVSLRAIGFMHVPGSRIDATISWIKLTHMVYATWNIAWKTKPTHGIILIFYSLSFLLLGTGCCISHRVPSRQICYKCGLRVAFEALSEGELRRRFMALQVYSESSEIVQRFGEFSPDKMHLNTPHCCTLEPCTSSAFWQAMNLEYAFFAAQNRGEYTATDSPTCIADTRCGADDKRLNGVHARVGLLCVDFDETITESDTLHLLVKIAMEKVSYSLAILSLSSFSTNLSPVFSRKLHKSY